MLARLRRFCTPALATQTTHPVLAATTSRKALHTAPSLENKEYPQDSTDPYLYTTGRWLNRDKLQREARYIKFDFPALCTKAVDACSGATKVIRYEKKEGGFNRAFVLYLDNGVRVVARVPFRIAGPRRLATNSEVATMAYIRSFTKIPVPKVLDWSDDDSNSIGTEYIIMEHVSGVQLHEKWPSMSSHQHMLCVKSVTFMVTEMAKLPFTAYGSLYFADGPIDPKSKIDFVNGFCIGPHCGTQYWDCNAGETRFYEERPPNRGPWSELQSYCSGLIDNGFSRIPKANNLVDELPYRGSVQEHLRLLSISEKVITELIKAPMIQKVASPTLLHPDIHKRNIYVSEDDPSCVTAIIDWQSTSIEPTFVYANETPDLVEDPTADIPILEKLMLSPGEHPSNVDTSEGTVVEGPEEESTRKRHEKDVLTCKKTFEVILKGYVRKLHDARAMDQTLLRPFRYCDASWRDSAAALRQELIELSQRWTELGLPGSCPYQPTLEELNEHAKQYEDFESMQQLKMFLKRALDADSDGWVPAENWEVATKEHQNIFAQWMESIRDSGSSEDRARKLWPFDQVNR
ncbi:Altered inheritance of mitochondria protein, mitochondrial [Lachnellula occidentalis]|uniref:Altered inheritance of mitochondria protein 9, mitochondrial n=1 Tax=Lachnellula occidentalis TaxID=215460 RepID=A0A8H8S0B0_9HELO|nr:Altered inheritance of mitochondria protein, mitochondrial [Lachnellula occidentalis]